MPKKTRRMKERAAIRREAVSQESGDSLETIGSNSSSTLTPMARATYTAPTFDYSHIYRDLRRIAFFAIFFFAVLIALSFVIK
jgi:hypothetical protein